MVQQLEEKRGCEAEQGLLREMRRNLQEVQREKELLQQQLERCYLRLFLPTVHCNRLTVISIVCRCVCGRVGEGGREGRGRGEGGGRREERLRRTLRLQVRQTNYLRVKLGQLHTCTHSPSHVYIYIPVLHTESV